MLYVQSLVFCFGRSACFQVHEFPSFFSVPGKLWPSVINNILESLSELGGFFIWKKPLAKEESSLLPCHHISLISGTFRVSEPAGMHLSYPCTEKSWELLAPLVAYTESNIFTWYTSLLRSPWLMINKHSAKGSLKGIVLYFCILF